MQAVQGCRGEGSTSPAFRSHRQDARTLNRNQRNPADRCDVTVATPRWADAPAPASLGAAAAVDDGHRPLARPDRGLTLLADLVEGQPFFGRYRIKAIGQRRAQTSSVYWRLELEDRTGVVVGYLWREERAPARLQCGDVIFVEGKARTRSGMLVADLRSIARVDGGSGLYGVDLLPSSRAANPHDLTALAALCANLKNRHLRAFVNEVFMQPAVWQGFTRLPAALLYHHAAPGGLLRHSLEVAQLAWELARTLDPVERELALVAGLFHDVGKVLTLSPEHLKRGYSQLVAHELLNFELCASALRALDMAWPDAAMVLRSSWMPRHTNHSLARNTIGEIVRSADRVSAELGKDMAAFMKGKNQDARWSFIGKERRFRPEAGLSDCTVGSARPCSNPVARLKKAVATSSSLNLVEAA